MIEIASKKNKYTYNAYHLVKSFFPGEEIAQKVDEKQEPLLTVALSGGSCFSIAEEDVARALAEMLSAEGRPGFATEEAREQAVKKEVTRQLYRRLREETGRSLAWGTLTGVRPTKIPMEQLEQGKSEEEAAALMEEKYEVSHEKAVLASEVAARENALLSRLDCEKGFSLYVGIPFCPTVCSYCSFSSSPIGLWKDRVDAYMDALVKELRYLGRKSEGRRPDTVYIGGGTPTTLEPDQLRRLLDVICGSFDLSGLLEFTVEAGRPDSITEEKLSVIREYPVTRISVNPQTMQQRTLDLVGRRHTAEQTVDAFRMARAAGFGNINMDLIAGAPGGERGRYEGHPVPDRRTPPGQSDRPRPCHQRAARFGQEGRTAQLHEEIAGMVEEAYASARRMGLVPYYLYRQKNIAGNFENVGYAELDKAGIYNILIMEEKQTILAAGAGASTKVLLKEPVRMEGGKEINLVRAENVKNIEAYISRIDEMIERKEEWLGR